MSRAALPIVFRCGLPGNSRGWEGRVEVIRQGNNMAELIIAGRGSRMNAVIGKYLSGQYICIPDLDTGCPLSRLTDTFWNSERLSGRIPEVDAITIAYALEAVSEYLGGGLDLTARDIQLCAKELLGEVCGEWGQNQKREGKSRPSGIYRAACLRIVYGLGAIPCRDTKCSIQRCQTITGRRMEKAVWKAAVNRKVNTCVYN